MAFYVTFSPAIHLAFILTFFLTGFLASILARPPASRDFHLSGGTKLDSVLTRVESLPIPGECWPTVVLKSLAISKQPGQLIDIVVPSSITGMPSTNQVDICSCVLVTNDNPLLRSVHQVPNLMLPSANEVCVRKNNH